MAYMLLVLFGTDHMETFGLHTAVVAAVHMALGLFGTKAVLHTEAN
jgi:hypothetical protein